jgi:enoyl-CoA hydratase/carnithine racemase
VAFAHGSNFGAGVDLFAACRWRVAEETATFRLPGLAFGLVLGTRRFARLIGAEKARDILQGLRKFDAAEAQAMGFVRRILDRDRWETVIEEAAALARTLPDRSRRMLQEALDDGDHDRDMALLVRSASAPGIKSRLRTYLDAARESKLPLDR